MDTISIILIVGTLHGYALGGVLLLKKRGNRTANRILALIVIHLSCLIMFDVFGHSFVFPDSNGTKIEFWFIRLIHVFSYVLMPLLYFYTKALTVSNFKFKRSDRIHTLPFFIFAGTTTFLFFYYDGNIDIVQACMLCMLSDKLMFPAGMAYIITSLIVLHRHERNIKTTFSSLEKINLSWLKFLLLVYLTTMLLSALLNLIGQFEQLHQYLFIIMIVVFYIISYKGLMQPEIFIGEFTLKENQPGMNGEKYKKSALTNENADAYYNKLMQIMDKEKPYLDNELTLPGLAKMLSISIHHLSQIINEKCGQSYFDYVNQYRINESKNMLVDPENQNFNIASIALKAGFNSLSSFNAAFKKNLQMTPSQYKAKNRRQ